MIEIFIIVWPAAHGGPIHFPLAQIVQMVYNSKWRNRCVILRIQYHSFRG